MKTNVELFRTFIEKGFSDGDITVFDSHASPDSIERQNGFNPPNAEGVKKSITSLNKAFPD